VTAANFQELTTVLQTVPAEVLILDLGGMGGSPLTVVERLRREHPHLAILVFSSSVDLVPELLRAGAKGYVVKEELSDQLITAIQALRSSPGISGSMTSQIPNKRV
jgi:DNA-binding NarL/FixJ family response regulator